MQRTRQNLVDDYEIISKEASSNCSSGYRFWNIKTKPIREYIQRIPKVPKNDLRLDKVVRSTSEVREFVVESLSTLGYSDLKVEEQLHDIAYMLMSRFRINHLNCRMELVYSDKCMRFHVDNVYLRAITTLVGPGTELQMVDEPERIHKVNTGDTLLIKGKQFPGECTKVLHRSPRISHLEIPRVVFVMDY